MGNACFAPTVHQSVMNSERNIYLTSIDERRLSALLRSRASTLEPRTVDLLEEELARARIVEPYEVPRDVVTMNSIVSFEDLDTGEQFRVTLVYPSAGSGSDGRVSVLAPVGSALLGLAVGDSIDWPLPDGRSRRVRVIAVPYQPEAGGQLDL